MSLASRIESILFVSDKPLSVRRLALISGASMDEIRSIFESIKQRCADTDSGVSLVVHADRAQFVTHPDNSGDVAQFLREELSGELTRAALETLAIISYRGPATKSQIESIRGINCSLALRNLLLRGLIEAQDRPASGEKVYTVSFQFLRHLGLSSATELPCYSQLHDMHFDGSTKDAATTAPGSL